MLFDVTIYTCKKYLYGCFDLLLIERGSQISVFNSKPKIQNLKLSFCPEELCLTM